jgi:hypothetical protein
VQTPNLAKKRGNIMEPPGSGGSLFEPPDPAGNKSERPAEPPAKGDKGNEQPLAETSRTELNRREIAENFALMKESPKIHRFANVLTSFSEGTTTIKSLALANWQRPLQEGTGP